MNKWTLIIAVILIAVGGVIGWLVKPSGKPQSVNVKEVIVRDTIEVEKVIKVTEQTIPNVEYITIRDTIKISALTDSTKGRKNDVEYKIDYSYEMDKPSIWEIDLKALTQNIREFVTKDSIQTVVKTEYFSRPFFLDPYFYGMVAEFFLLIVTIIF